MNIRGYILESTSWNQAAPRPDPSAMHYLAIIAFDGAILFSQNLLASSAEIWLRA
jgi:hypothetical protein